jgi:hypothetical protein
MVSESQFNGRNCRAGHKNSSCAGRSPRPHLNRGEGTSEVLTVGGRKSGERQLERSMINVGGVAGWLVELWRGAR